MLAYVILVPWTARYIDGINGHDYARILEVVVCTICGLTLVPRLWQASTNNINQRGGDTFFIGHTGIAILTLLALVSVSMAAVPSKALQELTLFIGLACLSGVVASRCTDSETLPTYQAAIVASLIYYNIIFMGLVFGLLNGHAADIDEMTIDFINIRFFNHVQTAALPLIATSIHRHDLSRAWKLAAWMAMAIGFALLLLSGGRGTFVGILFAATLSPLWMRLSTWTCIRPLALSALSGTLFYLVLFIQLPHLLGLPVGANPIDRAQENGSVVGRIYLWKLAIAAIQESPFLGIGPMHYAHRPHPDAAHPHNIYLQIASEWGIPILLLVLFGLIGAIYRHMTAIRSIEDQRQKLIGGSLLIACTAILVDGLVSGNFVMPVSQVWIAICVGMATQWTLRHTQCRTNIHMHASIQMGVRFCALLIAAAMLVQIALLLRDLRALAGVLDRAAQLSVNEYRSPRYWSNGWF